MPDFVVTEDLTIKPKELIIVIGESPFNVELAEQKKEADRLAELAKKNALRSRLTSSSGRSYGGKVEILAWGNYYNCYAYVKSVRYVPRTRNGNAGTTPTNSKTPAIGAAAVMYGHIAIVESYTDTTVTIIEANYIRGAKTRRTIPRNSIYGYWI